jgi:hypothetical protein
MIYTKRGANRGPARVALGELAHDADLLLLSEVADRWPDLRRHFGATLLDRLNGGMLSHSTNEVWDYLALVADRQPVLSAELADAVAAEPALLDHDGVLAWYASAHRGEEDLLNTLIARVDVDGTNARPLSTMLLAEPRALGQDPEVIRTRLRSMLNPKRMWYPPYLSGVFEVLADAFPEDEIVRQTWATVAQLRSTGQAVHMHPRAYYPMAYAAVPTADLLVQLERDIHSMATRGRTYFDPQFARAVVRRLRRDSRARTRFEETILNPETNDPWAAQLASFLATAHPLSQNTVEALYARLERQQSLPMPDAIHDYTVAVEISVTMVLLEAATST